MSGTRAKVAVVSPYPMVTEGLTAMLGRHGERVEVIELQPTAHHEEPDVVLYDVACPAEGRGQDLDHLVNHMACVVFAVGRDLRPDLLGQALAHSVDGFFSMNVTESELLAAVDSAVTGWQEGDDGPDPVVGSSESAQRSHLLGADVGLSERETEVLSLIARGLSNDEIAHRSFLSINSVKTYIRTGYRKIGARSRSQAVAWATQHGFATTQDREPPR